MTLRRNTLTQFYKYTSPTTALKIIEGRRLRWSSPVLFNDPFDHQTGFLWNFSGEELSAELVKWMEHAVYDVPNYSPTDQTAATRLVHLMRQRRPPRDKFRDFSAEVVAKESGQDFPRQAARLNEEVTRFLLDSQVLCLSEVHDNVVLWAHYAQSHQGAVYKLRRLEHLDHRFLVAQPVEYTSEPATYASATEYARHLLGIEQFDPTQRIWRLAYRKHKDWSYEREWRVHLPLMGKGRAPWYYDEGEPAELFEAVYLGCRATAEFSQRLLTARNAHLPKMDVFRAVAVGPAMQLRFEKIQ